MKKENNIWPNRKSIRLEEYDYSTPGAYFITISTRYKLGKVESEGIKLNKVGEFIFNSILKISKMFSTTKIDEYIVMPDHIHFILVMLDNSGLMNQTHTSQQTNTNQIGTERDWRLMKSESLLLGKIIRAFKAKAAREIREDFDSRFKWHRNYFERIIRNEKELKKFRKYIIENPSRLINKK